MLAMRAIDLQQQPSFGTGIDVQQRYLVRVAAESEYYGLFNVERGELRV